MIKLNRAPEPRKLADHKTQWLANLQALIARYGSYKAIPEAEREKGTLHYKDNEIKEALFRSSWDKCAYCECNPTEGGYIEIDHFKPKSRYPEYAFDWDNLLPSCGRCNKAKSDYDTVKNEIVNPYDLDPEGIFYFDAELIQAKPGSFFNVGKRTIEVCTLNRNTLTRPRLRIYQELQAFIAKMEKTLNKYSEAPPGEEKLSLRTDLAEALSHIELFKNPDQRYAGFCRSFLNSSASYQKAKTLISNTA
jgi:uncharacterized protein (TIGR02646 family)